MRRYFCFSSASLQTVLEYRSLMLANLATSLVSTALVVFLWRAVIVQAPGDEIAGFGQQGITTYLLAAQLMNVVNMNQADSEISSDVLRGSISISLVRPVSYPIVRFMVSLPVILVNALLIGVPLILIFGLIFDIEVPSLWGVCLFLLAMIPAVIIGFEISFLTGVASLVTTNIWGVRVVVTALVGIFSGSLVPIDLMPPMLARISTLLPFKSMINAPVQLLLRRYDSLPDAALIILGQYAWSAALLALCALLWHGAMRKIEVLGG
ncbi:ABC transporter permease [Streptomyces sp. NBC_00564]|uniref:ABC transporter permease n=1 Tax=Streptomyces sp. NBC_00564 TaxID=2903663 RepID=UPI00352ECEA3|nr:ABC-2 family transporter protein [Streptomyces sp. NBC_00564]